MKKEEIFKSSFIRFILLNSCLKYITVIVENTEYRNVIWKILCNIYIKLAITGNVLCVWLACSQLLFGLLEERRIAGYQLRIFLVSGESFCKIKCVRLVIFYCPRHPVYICISKR